MLLYHNDLSAGTGLPCSRKTSAVYSGYFKFTLYHICRQKDLAKPVLGKAYHEAEKLAIYAVLQHKHLHFLFTGFNFPLGKSYNFAQSSHIHTNVFSLTPLLQFHIKGFVNTAITNVDFQRYQAQIRKYSIRLAKLQAYSVSISLSSLPK